MIAHIQRKKALALRLASDCHITAWRENQSVPSSSIQRIFDALEQ